ncbi:DNA oxidative demethylase AlkB [Bradyrhizobium sp. ISRA443]|uniref:DNA oxidative demethylase AlkB n=1 Tax=unclassified Bradyrhizobium TaxID=2631580 RepID=UPI002478E210|nr:MULTISPECIES: DNA oxidative demethylase AlkB [unclassified Bradyrhizobium]WGR91272.1 DNA oxidative demethylase AlkB [Bradyrhizobium sp. ISRA435]WGS01494.1 DNA oxidative demethylase AlkB [Bradyrhizobium sp. ISRA436]WGS08381.1 DNA oxidative demethylase AlkB [Bradyrhizobium sp. ISRA437]WGS15269.1 DNA oxidative demethylase AlkB [Bradyrhizobium sp. ISRA443]
MTADLFETVGDARPPRETMAEGAVVLRGFARPFEAELIPALREIVKQAPFRHLITPGGHRMSVAMTNCGSLGWVSDPSGYRYDGIDPNSGAPWPPMPPVLRKLAADAAAEGGFTGFTSEACLINRYVPGAKLSLHQDKDELDFAAPIVSVSLGLPAIFLFGGLKRSDPTRRYRLEHGDVVVWGGPSRLVFHGVAPLAEGEHGVLGRQRINLTFRKVRRRAAGL